MAFLTDMWTIISTNQMAVLSVLAIVIAIVGIVLRERRRKGFSYNIGSANPVVSVEKRVADRVRIYFDDEQVENVHLIVMDIWNSGNQSILETDFNRDVSFNFGEDALILSSSVVAVEPRDLEPSFILMGNSARLSPLLLNDGDRMTVNFLVSNWDSDALDVDGRIIGVKNIKRDLEISTMSQIFIVLGLALFPILIILAYFDIITFISASYGAILAYVFVILGTILNKKIRRRYKKTFLSFFPFQNYKPRERENKDRDTRELVVGDESERDRRREREPSYPNDRWEFLWFRYTEVREKPWGEFITRSYKKEIDFDDNWEDGIVNNSGLSNNVAFKASRTLRLDAGRYTFLIGADDGIRLYVYNNDLTETYVERDEWRDQGWSEFELPPVDLPAGDYKILIEWYENYGDAHASFKLREGENKKGKRASGQLASRKGLGGPLSISTPAGDLNRRIEADENIIEILKILNETTSRRKDKWSRAFVNIERRNW